MSAPQTVAVLGASRKPERYANKAVRLLEQHGHRVLPVNPAYETVEGISCYKRLADLPAPVDTLTLYLTPEKLEGQIDAILALRPGRVIFNPGTELPALRQALDAADIPYLEACTLVLLNTGQF